MVAHYSGAFPEIGTAAVQGLEEPRAKCGAAEGVQPGANEAPAGGTCGSLQLLPEAAAVLAPSLKAAVAPGLRRAVRLCHELPAASPGRAGAAVILLVGKGFRGA